MSDSTAAPQVFCKKMSGVYFSAISHCLRFQSRRRIRCSTFAYIILCNCSLYTLYPPVRPPCIVRRYQQPKRISPTNRIRRILKQIHSAPQPNRILTNESSRDLCKIPPKSPKFPPKTFRGFSMSTFFQQTAQAMIAKHIDRFPLLKLDQVIDWHPIEQYRKDHTIPSLPTHWGGRKCTVSTKTANLSTASTPTDNAATANATATAALP